MPPRGARGGATIEKGNPKMSKCGEKTEVYSRVTGYFRPVSNWNKGKKEEFKDRKTYDAVAAGHSCCCGCGNEK